MTPGDASLQTRRVGPEAAAEVLTVVKAAFADRPRLDPPTDALAETEDSMAAMLAASGGLLALDDGRPVGALVLDPAGEDVYLRRVSVDPAAQGHGIAHVLVRAALHDAGRAGFRRVRLLAREELPRTIRFWRELGFVETGRHAPYVELARPAPVLVDVPDAEDMRGLGRRLAGSLRGGDVLVLSGELGAGKTTFTQGLGEGLGVRGAITSPTFVIARVHPSLGEGPELVHVDAYRLGGQAELDDLDLDTDLDEAVTVVEWGTGIAESLAEARLEVRITRATGESRDIGEIEADPRVVELDGIGVRWLEVDLRPIG
ncbi:tRNA (adenosine(37)-N6)-threonylcarbamoyltransferase complex ATPase subunit type 1 TsaE [Nocardioides nitrophenolicus]|uniref:tRNA (adenosine(37)-N6)-threonylcarbamoyltransferase complex ATPase subunit type 1 TsaE n=1 Tax=Nocardioides nitrophenolicus TaxID=60489 RepID=UPI00195DF82A|nr:tRNA (adenosine(37)-N6)-threonylcarbamoyltransferase complex ATPase subunit type 1 TsaE [Nocardioides nitrophenolicus]MBM7518931.1 tRNA threonylcarbamoyladenosine biosynthesis protein TsaE [Nocardioides nitrophenolicus]